MLKDLGIIESRFRRKLVKFITMRLLGVGDSPAPIEGSEVDGADVLAAMPAEEGN